MSEDTPTMYEVAVAAVRRHVDSCTEDNCEWCSQDFNTLVDGVIEHWLMDE